MKMDQVAFYCNTPAQSALLKSQLGLSNEPWIDDTVTARSIIDGIEGENIAELQFNYSLGIEFEIIRYVKGYSWHNTNPLSGSALARGWSKQPFISHVGIHLEDSEAFPEMEGAKLVQETFTISHTSEYLTKEGSPGFGRLYHYRIFEISPGSYVKYIKRIHKGAK